MLCSRLAGWSLASHTRPLLHICHPSRTREERADGEERCIILKEWCWSKEHIVGLTLFSPSLFSLSCSIISTSVGESWPGCTISAQVTQIHKNYARCEYNKAPFSAQTGSVTETGVLLWRTKLYVFVCQRFVSLEVGHACVKMMHTSLGSCTESVTLLSFSIH